MDLIDELKKEHVTITATLEKINQKGIGSDECQTYLLKAKSLLLNHLAKEDRVFYPTLNEVAKNNEYIRRTLKSFADDMKEVSTLALNFFDKYATGGKGIEFAKDYGRLYSKLSMRIRKEETVLYTFYESLDPANIHKEAD